MRGRVELHTAGVSHCIVRSFAHSPGGMMQRMRRMTARQTKEREKQSRNIFFNGLFETTAILTLDFPENGVHGNCLECTLVYI